MSAENSKVERTVGAVQGERSLPSVNTAKRSNNNLLAIAFIVIALLVTFAYGYFSFFGKKKVKEDEVKAQVVKSNAAVPFIEDVKIDLRLPPEPKPEPEPEPKSEPKPEPVVVSVKKAEPPKPLIDHSASGLMIASKDKAAKKIANNEGQARTSKTMQGDDSNLGEKLVATKTEKVKAVQLKNRHYLLAKGTVINCSLQTQIDTSVPGFVSCVTTRDVYSDTGTVLLLERGTQIVGEYQNNIQEGVERLFILWTRAKTPNGIIVDLDSPAADPLGGAGTPGYVDHKFWKRFGTAMLLSVFNTAYTTGANMATIDIMNRQNRNNSGNNSDGIYYPNNNNNSGVTIDLGKTGQPLNDIINQILSKQSNIPEIMTKNRGEKIAIFVARDLDFSGVYDAQSE